jgi:hypothetical protein
MTSVLTDAQRSLAFIVKQKLEKFPNGLRLMQLADLLQDVPYGVGTVQYHDLRGLIDNDDEGVRNELADGGIHSWWGEGEDSGNITVSRKPKSEVEPLLHKNAWPVGARFTVELEVAEEGAILPLRKAMCNRQQFHGFEVLGIHLPTNNDS